MASILDLHSDCSDSEDDCDYVPEEGDISEGSHAEDSEDESCENKKRNNREGNDHVEGKIKLTEEEEKKKADELFKKFLEEDESDDRVGVKARNPKDVKETDVEKKVTVTEEYDFAGETVKVTKEMDASSAHFIKPSVTNSVLPDSPVPIIKPSPASSVKRSGGLSSVVGVLSKKKQKLSTLEKSLLDWNSFKKDEGIEEELKIHNKGKGGFLEKQAFLQRSDLRQFEIEKNLRLSRRSKP